MDWREREREEFYFFLIFILLRYETNTNLIEIYKTLNKKYITVLLNVHSHEQAQQQSWYIFLHLLLKNDTNRSFSWDFCLQQLRKKKFELKILKKHTFTFNNENIDPLESSSSLLDFFVSFLDIFSLPCNYKCHILACSFKTRFFVTRSQKTLLAHSLYLVVTHIYQSLVNKYPETNNQ